MKKETVEDYLERLKKEKKEKVKRKKS